MQFPFTLAKSERVIFVCTYYPYKLRNKFHITLCITEVKKQLFFPFFSLDRRRAKGYRSIFFLCLIYNFQVEHFNYKHALFISCLIKLVSHIKYHHSIAYIDFARILVAMRKLIIDQYDAVILL